MTAKNFCKKDRLYIKSPTQRHRVQKVFSKFNPLFVVLNNISVTQVRVSESKINLLRPLKPLCHQLPSLHDLIISAHVKHHLINLPKMVCSPMQGFFTKKVPPYFVGEVETLCFIFISFPISESFIPNFCGINYDLSNKTT